MSPIGDRASTNESNGWWCGYYWDDRGTVVDAALSSAQAQAHRIAYVSNLKHLGVALHLYAELAKPKAAAPSTPPRLPAPLNPWRSARQQAIIIHSSLEHEIGAALRSSPAWRPARLRDLPGEGNALEYCHTSASPMRDATADALSKWSYMNQREPMNLALSATAEEYLQRTLPAFHKRASERGFVTSLKYSGRTGYVKDRTMVSAYHCREFVLCGEQPENLQSGEYHDLMGFQIWIGDLERDLLQGRQLTMIKVERPEPMELLGIENAPKGCFSQ